MPFPPPPPPPGPPPPNLGVVSNSNGDGRGLLLQSIRQGKTLKKTVTNDRSTPLVAGKTKPAPMQNISNTSLNNNNNNNNGTRQTPNSLGGLFADGMPKLKPTGRLGSPRGVGGGHTSPSPNSTLDKPFHKPEVVRKLSSDTRNRGPPPQPPPANQKPVLATSVSDSIIGSRPTRGPPTLPSKPPVGGYGKPNLAPKPPGPPPPPVIVTTPTKPSPPPKKLLNGSTLTGRAPVTRAQSMRVPRSPPVAPPATPPFPPGGYRAFHQSQDSLHPAPVPPRTATLPSNLHQHGKQAPPPPPLATRPLRPPVARPPPPPSRQGIAPQLPPPPPPPPPHRTAPAPTPPPAVRLAPPPPAPPVRNSSMRNGVVGLDVETRFAFRKIHELPQPPAFLRVVKLYNSRQQGRIPGGNPTTKQPAPQPPAAQLQLSHKLWSSNTSTC